MSDMREGKIIGAIAMTEPSAGSDLQGNFCNKNFENHNIFFLFFVKILWKNEGIKTTATEDGDDYILNGSKVFITNGWNADVVLVVAITDKEAE